MNPEVSILIPLYNVEKYIEKCLISVLNNTWIKKAELLICDDCSTDNSYEQTKSIVNKYNINNIPVKFFKTEKNSGIGYVRKLLLKNATGKYIISIDSDDYIERNYIECFLKAANDSDADLIQCNIIIHKNNKVTYEKLSIPDNSFDCIKGWFTGSIHSWLHVKMFKRSLIDIEKLEYLDECRMGEDTIILLNVYKNSNKIIQIDDFLYNYVRRGNSLSRKCRSVSDVNNIINTLFNYLDIFITENYSDNQEINELYKKAKYNRKIDYLFNGSYKAQKEFLNLWPETDSLLKFGKKSHRIVLSCKNKFLCRYMLFCNSMIRIVFGRIKLKDYFEK